MDSKANLVLITKALTFFYLSLAFVRCASVSPQAFIPNWKPTCIKKDVQNIFENPLISQDHSVWIRPQNHPEFQTDAGIESVFRKLKDGGFNQIYWAVWSEGTPLYTRGEAKRPFEELLLFPAFLHFFTPEQALKPLVERDLVTQAQLLSEKIGLNWVPWFDGGYAIREWRKPVKGQLNRIKRLPETWQTELTTSDTINNACSDHTVYYLDPSNAEIKKNLAQVISEFISTYSFYRNPESNKPLKGKKSTTSTQSRQALKANQKISPIAPSIAFDEGWVDSPTSAKLQSNYLNFRQLIEQIKLNHPQLQVTLRAPAHLISTEVENLLADKTLAKLLVEVPADPLFENRSEKVISNSSITKLAQCYPIGVLFDQTDALTLDPLRCAYRNPDLEELRYEHIGRRLKRYNSEELTPYKEVSIADLSDLQRESK